MMKRLLILAAVLIPLCAQAQISDKEFIQRYNSLVSKVGSYGVGVETLIEKWEAACPDSRSMLNAKAVLYLSKAQTQTVIQKDQPKYLGNQPLMALKDSLGLTHNYFADVEYDETYFSKANKAIDQAISKYPYDLMLRSDKISALIAFEKENPDMALQNVKALIDYNFSSKPSWRDGDAVADKGLFDSVIQDICYKMYLIGSDDSMAAFKAISEKMISYEPKSVDFLNNLGSYYLVYAKDPKSAIKQYSKVLKLDPKNYAAIKNCILASRRTQDSKAEKKYLLMLAGVTDNEVEKASALKRAENL